MNSTQHIAHEARPESHGELCGVALLALVALTIVVAVMFEVWLARRSHERRRWW